MNFAWRRDEEPLSPPSYVLELGPARDAAGVPIIPGPDVVQFWDISTRWSRGRRIYLRRVA